MRYYLFVFVLIFTTSCFEDTHINDYDFLMVGDSITAYNNWNSSFPDSNIYNYGVPGACVIDIYNTIDLIIYNHIKYKIIIMIGINDFINNKSAEYIFKYYKKIINKCGYKNIVVMSTLDSNVVDRDSILSLNIMLQEHCKRNNVEFINLYLHTLPIEKYSIDGIHLNSKGYNAWEMCVSHLF